MLGQLRSCMPGTREQLLADIQDWMCNSSGSQQVFWLKGALGSGKTTIAYTVAQLAYESKVLGANFFFSRFDETLRNPRLLFPTIAFQLAQYHPAFKRAIAGAIGADPDISHRQPAHQFDTLLCCVSSALDQLVHPVVFIFDALDEFESGIGSFRDTMRLFIHNLTRLSNKVRVFLTSRPEPYLEHLICSAADTGLRVHDLDDDAETSVSIQAYLRQGLEQIPRWLGLEMEDRGNWSDKRNFELLVWQTSDSFVYASAALRFIGDPVVCDPRRQLDTILHNRAASASTDRNLHCNLDNLYILVLQRAYREGTSETTLETLRSIMYAIFNLQGLTHDPGGSHLSPELIAHFSLCKMDDVPRLLRNLRSLFASESPFNPHHHDSLKGLLTSRARLGRCGGQFFIDKNEHAIRWALRCLETVKQCCSEHRTNTETLDPPNLNGRVVKEMVCACNRWCCRYAWGWWAQEALRSDPDDQRWVTQGALWGFLDSQDFVSWLVKPGDVTTCFKASTLLQWNCGLRKIVLKALRQDAGIWKAFIVIYPDLTTDLGEDFLGPDSDKGMVHRDGSEELNRTAVDSLDSCARTTPKWYNPSRLCTLHQIRAKRERNGAECTFRIDGYGQVH
ncbi:hypothetical protein HGRIS_013681 [Hohenbuehelia grisea]|uniref:Nephrocystin 3-like N-terminal domain-containing protein n=1 Tax=Hohenbuehelia grisea TaxID=104357 RepID=A0ABR3IW91_9AGAR